MSEATNFWTLEELAAQVALALATDYAGAPNGRIRELPDLRTIRYYATLGLVDRPAASRGRTALYGRKHLLQLVAIKRLQTQGLTLVEIQQRLLGKTEQELAGLAQLPGRSAPATRLTPDLRNSFWRQRPAALPDKNAGHHCKADGEGAIPVEASAPALDAAALGTAAALPADGSPAQARQGVTENQPGEAGSDSVGGGKPKHRSRMNQRAESNSSLLQGVVLRSGITLLFTPLRPLAAEDIQAIQTAAGPLLKYLEKRFLISFSEKENP